MFCPYDCNNLIRIENYLIFALDYGPIVQGIEQKFPKLQIQVRFLVGLHGNGLIRNSGSGFFVFGGKS